MIVNRCANPAQNTRYAQALIRSFLLALGLHHVMAPSLFCQLAKKGRRPSSRRLDGLRGYGQPAILLSELRAASRPLVSRTKTTWLVVQSGCFIAP